MKKEAMNLKESKEVDIYKYTNGVIIISKKKKKIQKEPLNPIKLKGAFVSNLFACRQPAGLWL